GGTLVQRRSGLVLGDLRQEYHQSQDRRSGQLTGVVAGSPVMCSGLPAFVARSGDRATNAGRPEAAGHQNTQLFQGNRGTSPREFIDQEKERLMLKTPSSTEQRNATATQLTISIQERKTFARGRENGGVEQPNDGGDTRELVPLHRGAGPYVLA